MKVNTKNVVATMAYLIGLREGTWRGQYEEDCKGLFEELEKNKEAKIIRSLCKIRTSLILHFKKTDQGLKYDGKTLYGMEWFDSNDIFFLDGNCIKVTYSNKNATELTVILNRYISERIENCKTLFSDWVKWEYIKDLFIVPHYNVPAQHKAEFQKFMDNLQFYPFQCYIYWTPKDFGNILYNDEKFLNVLYSMNEESFEDALKCKSADETTKTEIYNFIDRSVKTILVVDCENSDAYKLYSVLKSLDEEELTKISKILLYDDANTGSGWDYLNEFTDIPVEHIETERVVERKSLVDGFVIAGICREFYTGNASSFILCSSDSDYWALISSLPEAEFLVMLEYEKASPAIRTALKEKGTRYCAIDDFGTGNIEDLKKRVLLDELKKRLPELIGKNGKELAHELFEVARVEAEEHEINNFYEKYIRTIKLILDENGNFAYEVKGV